MGVLNRQKTGPGGLEFISRSVQDTELLGRQVGRLVEEGDVLALEGELGSGKTAFVRGLAKGLCVPEGYAVTSPTYALVHTYPGRLTLFHVDLYRISGEDDAENIGLFEFLGKQGVCAVEWAQRLEADLWPRHLTFGFTIKEKQKRAIYITADDSLGQNLLNRLSRTCATSNWS